MKLNGVFTIVFHKTVSPAQEIKSGYDLELTWTHHTCDKSLWKAEFATWATLDECIDASPWQPFESQFAICDFAIARLRCLPLLS